VPTSVSEPAALSSASWSVADGPPETLAGSLEPSAAIHNRDVSRRCGVGADSLQFPGECTGTRERDGQACRAGFCRRRMRRRFVKRQDPQALQWSAFRFQSRRTRRANVAARDGSATHFVRAPTHQRKSYACRRDSWDQPRRVTDQAPAAADSRGS
jgi:hypothetical protein